MAYVFKPAVDQQDSHAIKGTLFKGLSFFVVQRVPSRSYMIAQIEGNGGLIVKLEAQADYVIADQRRPDAPVGSLSYTFIEKALEIGQLPPPDNHRAGPSADQIAANSAPARPLAKTMGHRTSRTPFTAEDDMILWTWVKGAIAENNRIAGNSLYERLAAEHPRHTYQSWRDRWVKILSKRSPPAALRDNVEIVSPSSLPTPPIEQAAALRKVSSAAAQQPERLVPPPEPSPPGVDHGRRTFDSKTGTVIPNGYTQQDFDVMIKFAPDIRNVPMKEWRAAFVAWASENPEHTAEEWRSFYINIVDPVFEASYQADDCPDVNAAQKSSTESHSPSARVQMAPTVATKVSEPEPEPERQTAPTLEPHVETASDAGSAPAQSSAKQASEMLDRAILDTTMSDEQSEDVNTTSKPDSPMVVIPTRANATNLDIDPSLGTAKRKRGYSSDSDSGRQQGPKKQAQRRAQSHVARKTAVSPRSFRRAQPVPASTSSSAKSRLPAPALTAKNLAKNTAVLTAAGPNSTNKGIDLPEDATVQDTNHLISFLQRTTNRRSTASRSIRSSHAQHVVIADSEDEDVASEGDVSKESLPDDSSENEQDEPDMATARSKTSADDDIELSFSAHPLAEHDVSMITTRAENGAATPTQQAFASPFKVDTPSSAQLSAYPPLGDVDSPGRNASHRVDLDIQSQQSLAPSLDMVAESSYPTMSALRPPNGAMRQPQFGREITKNDTQAVFARDTQAPDFDMPAIPSFSDDEDDDDSLDFVRSSDRGTSPDLEIEALEAALDPESMGEYVEAKLAAGYDLDQVQFALERTSMRGGLADVVLKLVKQGKGVPGGFRGIWTVQDDEDLQSGDSKLYPRLEQIHKDDELSARIKFLDEYRALQAEGQGVE